MLRQLLTLTVAAALFSPLAASAQAPATPATPAVPATPAAPTAPATPKNRNRVNGKITSIDAAAKTVTLSRRKKMITLSVPEGTKIFKIGERRKPSGTFGDLAVDSSIRAQTNGDVNSPVATEVHLQAPKNTAPAGTVAPATPAVPATP